MGFSLDINKIISHCFFSSIFGNYDCWDKTWIAFIQKAQGTPQKTTILISADGTVSKNDSKLIPPSPKPIPARI
ncbi:MAG: hypothetical protein KDD45_13385 [Bdellovibrionales bacterium]|nr:hypothetical protein [Bdellovibrionales bacterium]